MKIKYSAEKEEYEMTCCENPKLITIEYHWESPNHYDGISEYACENCKYRQGRWSEKELKEGEEETVYGK